MITDPKRVNPSPAAVSFQGFEKAVIMHFYKFHIGDYMSHTRHLSHYEDLAYRRLLDFYYLHEQPIKHRDAARHIGMRDHEEDVLTVLNEFFLSTENGFINTYADKQIADFHKHQAVSAFGAFIRDNPSLKDKVKKEDFISHYLAKSIDVYIGTLRVNDVPIVDTSSIHDAPLTNNHKPITNNQIKEKATSVAFVLPDWVPKETWEQFLEMRKRIKKPPTDYAIKLLIDKLSRFRSNGQDIKLVLEKSITSGWQDVFEIKGNPADNIRTTVPPSNEPDPALTKIIEDAKKATPMPDHIRQAMAQLRSKS